MQRLDVADLVSNTHRPPEGMLCDGCLGVAAEARQEDVDAYQAHLRRLGQPTRVVYCDCEQRAREYEAVRYSWMNLPDGDPKTFANFNRRAGALAALRAARDMAEGEGPAILTLVGGTGRGKSHLAEAIVRAQYVPGDTGHPRLRYEQVGEMLERLRATYDDEGQTIADALDYYRAMRVLVLDDLGAQRHTDWAVEQLTSIIDRRYRDGLCTVVTTNLTESQMRAARMMRIASRLYDHNTGVSKVVKMTCPDYRTEG